MIYAIKVNVYVDSDGTDCTNNGVSSKFKTILIEHPEGNEALDENDLPENFCVINKRVIFGETYLNVVPVNIKKSGKHSMFGGNFAWSCDSRFRKISEYPIPIHDRIE